MSWKCQFCGGEIDDGFRCKRCEIRIEDRMNFSGVHFEFAGKDLARRKYKELPFPTREDRCELCAFALPCIDTSGSLILPNRMCKLVVIGFDYDFDEPMFAWVKITGTCKRFKKLHEFRAGYS